jgi:nucleotidyltransferase substrate binding protein (TIGR01987 family)
MLTAYLAAEGWWKETTLIEEGGSPEKGNAAGTGPGAGLDIGPLVNAVARLQEGLERHRRESADDQLRDGLIQRFEFTYELAHRMLRRYLRQISPSPASFDHMPFQDLIRMANEQELLQGDWPAWRRYRDMRARISHAYEAAVAAEVAACIPQFLAEATWLRDRLTERLA